MNEKQTSKHSFRSGWKILLGLVIGIVIGFVIHWAFSPSAVVVADEAAAAAQAQSGAKEETIWTCSMHPQIRMNKPGLCPICGMPLIPVHKEAGDEGEMPRLTVSKAGKALMDIETSPVERKFVTADIRMVGKVAYDETRLAYITAWVPGRLDKLYVDYTGVPVKKGDHMVYMYSPELLSAQEELIQAIKAVGNIEKSDSRIIRDVTAGTVEAAREKLRLLGLTDEQVAEIEKRGTPSDHVTIYSPAGGIVVHKNAQEGMYVTTGTRIYTVADLTHVWVKLDAYESDLPWLRYGQAVDFTTVSDPGQLFTGTITFIDPVLDSVTRTVKVRVDVPNPSGILKPEMFVKAVAKATVAADGKVMDPRLAGKWICPMHPSVIQDTPGDCDICGMPLVRTESLGYVSADPETAKKPLVIPVTAALVTGKRAVVYVAVPDTEKPTYEGREVVLGPRAGNYYLVRSGVKEGERVVTHGNFMIDSALQIEAKPSMMMPSKNETTNEPMQKEMSPTAAEAKPSAPLVLSAASREQVKAVFEAYFTIQQALFADDLSTAQQRLKELKDALGAVDMKLLEGAVHMAWMKHFGTLNQILSDAAKADSLEAFREAFSQLSDELYAVGLDFGAPGKSTIYQLRCPMAFNNRGATWLQPDQDIRNPYFGAAMPKCGSVIHVIQPRQANQTGGAQHD